VSFYAFLRRPQPMEDNMPKATCIQNVTFGATGEVYVAGEEYNVPATTLKRYGDYFKRATAPKTKQTETEENK